MFADHQVRLGDQAQGGQQEQRLRDIGHPVVDKRQQLGVGSPGQLAEPGQLGPVAGAQRRDGEGGRHLPRRQAFGDPLGDRLAVQWGVPEHQPGLVVERVRPDLGGHPVPTEDRLEMTTRLGMVSRGDEGTNGGEFAAVPRATRWAQCHGQCPQAAARRRTDPQFGRVGGLLEGAGGRFVGADDRQTQMPGMPLPVAAGRRRTE